MSLKRDLKKIRSRKSIRALRGRIEEMTGKGPVALQDLVLICVEQHLQQRSYKEEDVRFKLTGAYKDAVQEACTGGLVKLRDISSTELAKSLSSDRALRFFVDALKGKTSAETEEEQDEIKEGVISGLQELLQVQTRALGSEPTDADRLLLRERAEDRLDGLIHFRLTCR